MFRRALWAAALLAAGAASAQAQCDTRFRVVNQSGAEVRELYFSSSANNAWGEDRLGADTLPAGRSIAFNPGGRGGNYDFRVVWMNGQGAELRQVNICQASEVIINRNGLSAR